MRSGGGRWVDDAGMKRAAFAFIFITVLLDMLALGVIVPVLPKLIVEMKGGDLAGGAVALGLFGSLWAAMQFLFSPVLGSLSARFGRRRVILLSNFGLGADYVLMALAPTLPWLLIGRIISGITSSSRICVRRSGHGGVRAGANGSDLPVRDSIDGALRSFEIRRCKA